MNAKNAVRIGLATLVVLGIAVGLMLVPVKDSIAALLRGVEFVGPWGPVVFIFAYAGACLFFIPVSMFMLGAGLLFGFFRGAIVVSLGSVLGTTLAFLIGRTLLRRPIEKRVASNPRFQALNRAVGMQSFRVVFLTRLSPVFPISLSNYAFGLTNVRLWKYALASWLGLLPRIIMYVYMGTALKSLADVASGASQAGTTQRIFFIVGLVMSIISTIFITRFARQAFDEALAEQSEPAETSC